MIYNAKVYEFCERIELKPKATSSLTLFEVTEAHNFASGGFRSDCGQDEKNLWRKSKNRQFLNYKNIYL